LLFHVCLLAQIDHIYFGNVIMDVKTSNIGTLVGSLIQSYYSAYYYLLFFILLTTLPICFCLFPPPPLSAREAAMGAGVPFSVPASTVTMACISANMAITNACEKIQSGNR
jgi:3-oxoacyl-(acyl-carrier-protein) synthase